MGGLGESVGLRTWLFFFCGVVEDVEILVTLEGGLEELNLAFALDLFGLCVRARLLIAVGLVEFGHLIDTLLVLHLNLEFEFELMKHAGDLFRSVWGVGLDEVEVAVRLWFGGVGGARDGAHFGRGGLAMCAELGVRRRCLEACETYGNPEGQWTYLGGRGAG